MQIYLTAAPDNLRQASRYTRRLAHAAYRIGPDGRLLRQSRMAQVRGGILVLDDEDCGPIRDRDALCREVWRECVSHGFSAAAADFERPVSEDRLQFLETLSQVLSRSGRRLYVPESYGARLPLASVLICTALSGGIFQQRLEEAARRFGPGRLALDLQRLRMEKARRYLGDVRYKVSDIARLVGFTDSRYFSSSFKKLYGMRPLDYRNSLAVREEEP